MTEDPLPDRPVPWWGYLLGLFGVIVFWVVLALTIGRYFGS